MKNQYFVRGARRLLKMQWVRFRTLSRYHNKNWRKWPILENGEKLVQIPTDMTFPYYADVMKLTEDRRIFVRERVLSSFLVAGESLKKEGFDLIAYDGYRSAQLQEELFWFYMKAFTANRFNLGEFFSQADDMISVKQLFYSLLEDVQKAMHRDNITYVSWPSTEPDSPSPHITGGAIDVWLHQFGLPVDMGVPFDWMEKEAGAFFHLKLHPLSIGSGDREVSERRTSLTLAMCDAGFSCYGPEFWHFNMGNQMDGMVTGRPACYSVALLP